MKSTLYSLLSDPAHIGKVSSTRLAGAVLVLAGIVFAFVHPDGEGMVALMLANAMVALGLRKRTGTGRKEG